MGGFRSTILMLLGACSVGGLSAQTPNMRAELLPGGIRILIDGEVFTEYVGHGAQRPYLYPLRGPSGADMTRTVPAPEGEEDHPHHRSFWFAHGDVNGEDFWTDGDDKGVQQHLDIHGIELGPGTAAFRAYTRWRMADGRRVLRDVRQISILAEADGTRTVDFTITLTADLGRRVVFGDTKEGSFALRLCPTLRVDADGDMLSSTGLKNGKVWGQRAEWVSCYGVDALGEAVAVTVFDHPQNLRHPTWWHARTYGLTAANPFGIHDFEKTNDDDAGQLALEPGESLTLRYRVRIEAGAANPDRLRQEFTTFSATQP